MQAIKQEKTCALVNPDGFKRVLVDEVIKRIERRGLKVIALKMVWAGKNHIHKHLPTSEEWMERLGNKTLKTFAEYGIDAVTAQGTDNPKEIGQMVKGALVEYLTSGPVVAMVVQGIHAIDMVRKLAGNTLPVFAEMGTIRGDYSVDSPSVANVERRAIHNIMHASETPEEAANEIGLWFTKDEIHEYKRAEEDIMF